MCHQLVMCEPLRGLALCEGVTERRTRCDYAICTELVIVTTCGPRRSVWYKTTPNTHDGASLYETFSPNEAAAYPGQDRVPLHAQARRLNMAEIEINVMNGQCLDRRLDSQRLMAREVASWERIATPGRHEFTGPSTRLARRKLRKLYRQSKIDGTLVNYVGIGHLSKWFGPRRLPIAELRRIQRRKTSTTG